MTDRDRHPWGQNQPGGAPPWPASSPEGGSPPSGPGATGVFGGPAYPGAHPEPPASAPWPYDPPRQPAPAPPTYAPPAEAPRVHEVVVRPADGASVQADPLERLLRSQAAASGSSGAPPQTPSQPPPAARPGSFTAFLESPAIAPPVPAATQQPPPVSAGSFTQLFQNSSPGAGAQASHPAAAPDYPAVTSQDNPGRPGGPVFSSPLAAAQVASPSPNRRETRFYPDGPPPATPPRQDSAGRGGFTEILQAQPPVTPPSTASPFAELPSAAPSSHASGPGSFTQLFAASASMRPDAGPGTQADEFPPLPPTGQERSFDQGFAPASGARAGSLTQMLQALDSPSSVGGSQPRFEQPFTPAQPQFEERAFAPPQSHAVGGATTAFSVPEAAAQLPQAPAKRGPGEFTRIMQASQQRAAGSEPEAQASGAAPGVVPPGGAAAAYPELPQWQMPGAPQPAQFQPPQFQPPQFQAPHFQAPQFQPPSFQAPQPPQLAPPQVQAVEPPKGPPWLIIGLVAVIVLLIAALLLVVLLRK